ncbi:zinc-dependent alcohol dehydrogenase [Peribacillus butanolivorans]|uniref:zinc-dependent alcohol dehydrogenase n=1 Tax=Peribacillus butanolivorans TaxID=421767 RepID=UPI0036639719
MKSLILIGEKGNKVVFENIGIPKIKGKQILVRVKRAGICGTDIKLYTGNYYTDSNVCPIVLGHEFIGEVVEVGNKVSNAKIGDRIVAQPTYISCEQCKYCKQGEFNLCKSRKRIGFDCDGVFAEFVRLNENQIYHVPDTISDDAGALIEPLTVAVRGVYRANVKPSDTVLISGPGAIGLLTALVAKQFGARVIVSGTPADVKRLEIASQLGVDMVVMTDELPKKLKHKEIEVDIVFECSGNEHAVNLGLNILRPKGQFVQIGTSSKMVNVSFMDIAYKELIVTGSIAAISNDWHTAINLMEKIQTQALLIVKKVLPLEEFEKGFDEFLQNGSPKILFTP